LARLANASDSPERQRKELDLQTTLGAVRLAVSGYAAPQTEQAYGRARELWEQLGCPSGFIRVPWGQWAVHVNRGELDVAQPLAEDLLRLGEQQNDAAGVIMGKLSLGIMSMFRGEFTTGRSHMEAVLRLYVPSQHEMFVRETGIDPHLNALMFLSVVLFCLGYLDQALARSEETIDEASRLKHRPSLATSLAVRTRLLALMCDNVRVPQAAERLLTLGVEHGFPFWRAQGRLYQGWSKVITSDLDGGIPLLREGITAYQSTGAQVWMPFHHCLEAQAVAAMGQIDAAACILNHALRASRRRGENWFEAELVRRGGELIRTKDPDAAENSTVEALQIAQRQNAKLWELRAALSLARLRRDQGRRAEARDLLGPIYGWFTEGFGTPDLKEAKALLEKLDV
jgi:predicted ATPase